MKSYLIKDTTVHERIELLKQWEETDGCENSGMDLMEFYSDYIDGKREIKEINADYSARYVSGMQDEDNGMSCGMGMKR
jgi:hypothetical protein